MPPEQALAAMCSNVQTCAGSSSTQAGHRAPLACSHAVQIISRGAASMPDEAEMPAEGFPAEETLPKQEQSSPGSTAQSDEIAYNSQSR